MYYVDGFEVALVGCAQIAQDTWIFYFSKPADFSFLPGQFVNVYIPGLDESDPDHERSLSVATPPAHEHLGFAVRMRDSVFKQGLAALKPGDTVHISLPMGELVLPSQMNRPMVMIAGGIGITPFHSMLSHLQTCQPAMPVKLIYANRSHALVAWHEDFEAMASNWDALEVIYFNESEDGERSATTRSQYRTGRINRGLLASLYASLPDSLFYLVGPDPMVEAISIDLLAVGVPAENVVAESFYGY